MAKRFTKSEIKKYMRLNAEGATVTSLSEKYGFSTAAFYRWKGKQNQEKGDAFVEATYKDLIEKLKQERDALGRENMKLRGLLMEAMLRN